MLTWLRSLARRALGIVDAPPVVADPDGLNISPATIASFQGMPVVRRKVAAPTIFPGVVPAASSPEMAHDVMCGPAYVALDSSDVAPAYTWFNGYGLGFPGYAYLAELSQRSEYRAPAEVTAQEVTREWLNIKTEGTTNSESDSDETDTLGADEIDSPDEGVDPEDGKSNETKEKITDIINALEEFGVRDKFRKAVELDQFFGRSQIFIDLQYESPEKEAEARKLPLLIDPATIKKGSLRGFTVIEPIWTTPYYYNANDPTRDDFYKPKAWFVLGKKIHASRLLTFVSRELPDLLKPAYNFGGVSLTQLMEPYVFQWLRTRNSVSDLIHNFSVMVLKTDMSAVLQGQTQGGNQALSAVAGEQLLQRAKLFTMSRDNQGLTLLDKDKEELEQVAVPLGSLDALQAQAQEHMAAPTHIPLVKLLGITPTGLNASSEGEIKVFYDYIRALQQIYGPHLKTILQIIQLHLFGDIDDAITYAFVPLTSPSVKELSDIRKADADSGRAYIEAGVLSPDEERERLIADPNSGYTNLSGPAPEPPEPELVNPDGSPYTTDPPDEGGEQKPPAADADPFKVVVPEKKPAKSEGAEAEAAVMNGAQVTALQGLIQAVAAGTLPKETASATILAAFPQLTPDQIEAMLSPLKNFSPAKEVPTP